MASWPGLKAGPAFSILDIEVNYSFSCCSIPRKMDSWPTNVALTTDYVANASQVGEVPKSQGCKRDKWSSNLPGGVVGSRRPAADPLLTH